VLAYESASPRASGSLVLEAALLGLGGGAPGQQLPLPESPPDEEDFQLYSLEGKGWRTWEKRPDFDASRAVDAHFRFNAKGTAVILGDGEKGRVLPGNCLIFAMYRSTRAKFGNVTAGQVGKVAASPHNRAVQSWALIKTAPLEVTNPWPAREGADAETIDETIGRTIEMLGTVERAITLEDYEELCRRTPGVQLARVTALANFCPSFPCLKAPGIVTILIVPFLPLGRPVPGPELRRAVAAYLNPRRIIGTRVEVTGPGYVGVAASGTVRALPGVSKPGVQQRIVDALNRFLDPLLGGPDGGGWPFGRAVYRAEILQAIDEVPGVDHVLSLALVVAGVAECGNICVPPTSLVSAGQHRIEVT